MSFFGSACKCGTFVNVRKYGLVRNLCMSFFGSACKCGLVYVNVVTNAWNVKYI